MRRILLQKGIQLMTLSRYVEDVVYIRCIKRYSRNDPANENRAPKGARSCINQSMIGLSV